MDNKNTDTIRIAFGAYLKNRRENFLKEDPKGQLAPDNFFTSKADLDISLTALYGHLKNYFLLFLCASTIG